MVSGGGLDWSDGGSPDRDPPGRKWVMVVCCPSCESTEVSRDTSKGGVAYWSCQCGHRWKESGDIGMGHARLV